MITGQGRPLTQEACQAGSFTPVMAFDCRGFEPLEFHFGGTWQAESVRTSFMVFEFYWRVRVVTILNC